MSCALAVSVPRAPERARAATAARRAGIEVVDIRLIPLCNAMVRRDSDTGPDESAGWGGQVPPCPDAGRGALATQCRGNPSGARAFDVAHLGVPANQVITRGYLTKRVTDR